MKDIWRNTFWGAVKVPRRTSPDTCTALAYLAFKGGVYEENLKAPFRTWFRRLADRRPDLAEVYVAKLYPVDEFLFVGPYDAHRRSADG